MLIFVGVRHENLDPDVPDVINLYLVIASRALPEYAGFPSYSLLFNLYDV